MRLGQIARKLGVSQGEIVRYLSGQNLGVEEGSNVKLDEVHIRSLYAHFAPSENLELKQTSDGQPESTEVANRIQDAPVENVDANASANQPAEAPESQTQTPAQPAAPAAIESGKTIRATRIELAGLKVIGKIELPQPKKKEPLPVENSEADQASAGLSATDVPTEDEVTATAATGENSAPRSESVRPNNRDRRRQDDKRRSQNKQSREQRPYKNPIAAQREREMEEEQQRRKEKAAQDKEKRTQNYQKRVKHSPPTKAARLIEEPLEQMSETTLNEQPTTWFGKFMKWFRS